MTELRNFVYYYMRVKFWGTRGSVPVPGPATLRYGGNTTCVEVEGQDGTLLVIDAGTGIRSLGNDLMKRNKQLRLHVLLTHYHWDHIQGWPFFMPAFLPGNEFIVFGRSSSADQLKGLFGNQMRSTYFPVEFDKLPSKFEFVPLKENSLKIGELHIQTIENCHPGGAFGLRILEKQRAFVFLTDHEAGLKEKLPHSYEDYVKFSKGAELLVHDAQFTDDELANRRTWGHSSFEEAHKLAEDSGAKRLAFTHHAPERIDFEIDRIINSLMDGRVSSIDAFGLMEGMEFTI